MYAIIRTGGKQYKVRKDDKITIEKLPAEQGQVIDITDVLFIGDGDKITAGEPLVAGAKVTATVMEQTRGDKVVIFKKKRRKNYRRKAGHRQDLTVIRITDIKAA